ncbi:MAG: hypothetical protein MUD01_24480, partial [Chloroflexaceae bacterium]|nr:hypothetical protein [Chloroflexaceae bacterium]
AMAAQLPFHDEAISQMQRMARGYMAQLVQQGIARGDLAADLDVDVATAVVSGVLREVGSLVLARLQINQEELPAVALSRFDSPEVERLFDDLIRVLEHGLGRKDM